MTSPNINPGKPPSLAVLIASSGRFELLEERALKSVRAQTVQPGALIVVVDSKDDTAGVEAVRQVISRMWSGASSQPEVIVLGNRRTKKSASGAWNSGLDELCRRFGNCAADWCVAILDDDDAWEPEHLEKCQELVCQTGVDMAIAGVIRHDDPEDQGRKQSIPATLDQAELFVRNIHIQGSNLFLRLSRLLEVGGFDENLPSCTDRDICLRLSRLNGFTTASLALHTVHHYADKRQDRLTVDRGTKGEGLRRFFRKHAADFDEASERRFLQLAQERFNFDEAFLRDIPPNPREDVPMVPVAGPTFVQGLYFVIGVASDSVFPPQFIPLLDDIEQLPLQPGVLGVSAVLLENGPINIQGRERWATAVEKLRKAGVNVRWLKPEDVMRDWADFQAKEIPNACAARLPIAVTRSILNYYVYEESKGREHVAAWILDDDKTFSFEVRGQKDDMRSVRRSPNVAQLVALRDAGVDVVIGQDTSSAPLPFEATLRLQLLDLEQALRRLSLTRRDGQMTRPAARREAGYYDLSRETQYLETPLQAKLMDGLSVEEAIAKATDLCRRLRAGDSVIRPLQVDEDRLPIETAVPSVMRGGSTVFFKPEQLMLCMQYSAQVGGKWIRRSDMVHSQVLAKLYGVKIVMHPAAAVRHGRDHTQPIQAPTDTLVQDVLGYGFYRGVEAALAKLDDEHPRGICGFFCDQDNNRLATRSAQKAVRERLAAIELSAWRIQGLVGSCLAWLEALQSRCPSAVTALAELKEELSSLREIMNPIAVRGLAKDIAAKYADRDFGQAYRLLDIEAVAMQSHFKLYRTDKLMALRVERARNLLGLGAEAELLGIGWEGAVFRVDNKAIKLLDISKPSLVREASPALQKLTSLPLDVAGLCGLRMATSAEGLLTIERTYVAPMKNVRPTLRQMLHLLEDCRKVGVIFRNLSRQNIVLAEESAKIIDYGFDFRLFSEADFELMARKAWLCVRFWDHPGLSGILTRSLFGMIPELEGFESFWKWYLRGSVTASDQCVELAERLCAGLSFKTLLDYGCGKQANAVLKFYEKGIKVTGYDPGQGMMARWHKTVAPREGLTLTDVRAEAVSGGPYDLVICSLVLCEIPTEEGLKDVLDDLKHAVDKAGHVIVIICDPVATFGPCTAVHKVRELPEGATYPTTFGFQEVVESGRRRSEWHRSARAIKRALLQAGLLITKELSSSAYELEAGLPASDFLGWTCKPANLVSEKSKVSLVIKASALEGGALVRQVEHLVGQLEAPRAFAERILVLDSKKAGFVREYAVPDPSQVLVAAEDLISRGLIDRVVMTPADSTDACALLNERWFGLGANCSHTSSGAPLAAPLSAFEACRSDYILQVDADLLIRRKELPHDYLGELVGALRATPGAVTVSLSVLQDGDTAFEAHDKDGKPFRVECRGCLFDREALLALRPFPNQIGADGKLVYAWHRSMDMACRDGRAISLRGGSARSGFVHPQNAFKRSAQEWNLVMAGIEQGALFKGQLGKVDLVGSASEWLPPPRPEPFIFVVTGRNVPYGKMLRCYESMLRQLGHVWGAVVIDDGSDELSREACRRVFSQAPNITLLQPRRRRGQLANTITAIRYLCSDPDAVIITLDMDDALIGSGVLEELAGAHGDGADLTVGSMVRADKPADYPANFVDLVSSRGGNVWQHLRSFRKRLFDGIPDWRLRLDGKYVEICVDWAFMVPMVERARSPRQITKKLYYYESSGLGKADQRAEREAAIARIMKRHRPGGHCQRSSGLLTKEEIMAGDWSAREGLLILRHADRPSLKGLGKGADEVAITEKGRAESRALGQALGRATQVVASGVLRARQTAQEMMQAMGHDASDVRSFRSLCRLSANHADRAAYDAHKSRLGWHALVDAWIDGVLDDPGAVLPSQESVMGAIRDLMASDGLKQQGLNIVVTHDFYVHALLEVMHGQRQWRGKGIPTLAGVFLDYEDARLLIEAFER